MRSLQKNDRITFMYNGRFRRVRVETIKPNYIVGFDQSANDYRTFALPKLASENPLRFLGVFC